MLRERISPPVDLFPPAPWALRSIGLDQQIAAEFVEQQETMFALANGDLGLRGGKGKSWLLRRSSVHPLVACIWVDPGQRRSSTSALTDGHSW